MSLLAKVRNVKTFPSKNLKLFLQLTHHPIDIIEEVLHQVCKEFSDLCHVRFVRHASFNDDLSEIVLFNFLASGLNNFSDAMLNRFD